VLLGPISYVSLVLPSSHYNAAPATEFPPPVCGIQDFEFTRQLEVMNQKRDVLTKALAQAKAKKING
jgi:hypothetical protein